MNYSAGKPTRRLLNTNLNSPNSSTSTPVSNPKNTKAQSKILASGTPINKEKRLIKETNGYLSGTMSSAAKSKKINQDSNSKKSKLLKTSHNFNKNSSNLLKLQQNQKPFYNKESVGNNNGNKKQLNTYKKSHKVDSMLTMNNNDTKSSSSNIFDFNEENEDNLGIFDFGSKEEFKLGEQFYEQKIRKLKEQLKELKELDFIETNGTPPLTCSHVSNIQYQDEAIKLDQESLDKLFIAKKLFEKEIEQCEQQYLNEYTKTVQDYHDKRREIKEGLKNEHEEMRKQIDHDRLYLDINADITDVKPPPPIRNLRRRHNVATLNDDLIDVDSTSILMGIHTQNTVISSNGSLISSMVNHSVNIVNDTTMILGQFSNTSNSNLIAHANTLNGFYANNNASNLTSQNLSQDPRKRKIIPAAITFTLNDEELNEDFKFLCKNLNNHKSNQLSLSSTSLAVTPPSSSKVLLQNTDFL
jgi:hypothetical protein